MKFKSFLTAGAVAALTALAATSATAHEPKFGGVYIGAHLGGGWGKAAAEDVGVLGLFSPVGNGTFDFKQSGLLGGIQAGVQQQFGQIVIGGELSYSGTGVKKTIASPFFPATDEASFAINGLMAATARFGYVNGNMMPYIKGGLAAADLKFAANVKGTPFNYENSTKSLGYTLGAGVDYKYSSNIVIGLEYDYYKFGSTDNSGQNSLRLPEQYKTSASLNTLTLRANYLFGQQH
jgi:outer membrane immunogenic protein